MTQNEKVAALKAAYLPNKTRNNYDQIYYDVLPYLQDCDFAEAGKRLRFEEVSPERLTVTFCGRPFEVTREAVRVMDGKKVDNNFLSVLIYYTISKADCEPEYQFTPMVNFSGGVFAGDRGGGWGEHRNKAIFDRFGTDYAAFHAAVSRMGMRYDGETAPLEHCYSFNVLPKMPVKVKYYEADEEFPPAV
ncbi:MAG: DUF3786 domain-containing protein, partial [Spirochaetaceae bacterium]|nr:DUF3786 domain-containing protein [Spirochaetaceae bacterium]